MYLYRPFLNLIYFWNYSHCQLILCSLLCLPSMGQLWKSAGAVYFCNWGIWWVLYISFGRNAIHKQSCACNTRFTWFYNSFMLYILINPSWIKQWEKVFLLEELHAWQNVMVGTPIFPGCLAGLLNKCVFETISTVNLLLAAPPNLVNVIGTKCVLMFLPSKSNVFT